MSGNPSLDEALELLEKKIASVENEIEVAKREGNAEEVRALRKKEEQLREEKHQLREEKHQLREEKLLLMKKEVFQSEVPPGEINTKKAASSAVLMGCRTLLDKFAEDFQDWHGRLGCGVQIPSVNAALNHYETCSALERIDGQVFDEYWRGKLHVSAPDERSSTQGRLVEVYSDLSQTAHLLKLIRTEGDFRPVIPGELPVVEKRLLYRLLRAKGESPVILLDGAKTREPTDAEKRTP